MKLYKIKRAIISVSDKSNLEKILPILKKNKIQIISSGGTFKFIKKLGYSCKNISDFTGIKEILEGRVKTLNHKIYGGILNKRKNSKHLKDLKEFNISNLDLIIVNFYPFDKIINLDLDEKNIIENIDIGGPALARSAAKNHNATTIITDPGDYIELSKELKTYRGCTTLKFRKLMSAKAFGYTSYYDSIIASWFNKKLNIKFPSHKTIHGKLKENLKYGENPHQTSKLYEIDNNFLTKKIIGDKLGYNNYNDVFHTVEILNVLKKNHGVVITKHTNPCGISETKDHNKSFKEAFNCDPTSSYGGILGCNFFIKKKIAKEISKKFFEVVVSKGFDNESIKILKSRKKLKLIKFEDEVKDDYIHYKVFKNAFLAQDYDRNVNNKKIFKNVTKRKPSKKEMEDLKFAFKVCRFVKSNAITLVKNKVTIGIGVGQPSRVDSCKLAIEKALSFAPLEIIGCVAASDAFFPFPDGVEELIKAGVKAIIQPGGSIRDKEIIKTANKANISMVMTGIRHFSH